MENKEDGINVRRGAARHVFSTLFSSFLHDLNNKKKSSFLRNFEKKYTTYAHEN